MDQSKVQGAMSPPPGIAPDFDLSHNPLRTTYTTALVLMLAFPSVLVPLRMYTKIVVMKKFKFCDVACIVGYINSVALIGLGFAFLDHGIGKHAWDIPISIFSKLAELLNIQQAVYMPAILFTKVAILLQMLEIFAPTLIIPNPRWYSLWTLIVLNVIFFTALMFIEIFQCSPRQKIWDPMILGSCLNINQTFVASGVINVVDDWVMLILPLIWTWKLRLRLKQKIGVSLIFATGIFACVTTVMRLDESIRSLNNQDISVSLLPVSLWAVAEVSAGLIIACLPVMPRLFVRNNDHTRIKPTEPSDYRGVISKGKLYIKASEFDVSLPSSVAESNEMERGEANIWKNVDLDRISTDR